MSSHISTSVCPEWARSNDFDWCAPAGISRLKGLLHAKLPYVPKVHQLQCTGRILMGQHVMCVWATGEGKSSVFYLHALVRRETLTIVVSPTNALEGDMVRRLQSLDIRAVAINRETLNAAASEAKPRNLWDEVKKARHQVVLLSPEMLQSNAFKGAIKDPGIRMRLAVFCVDECHLVDEWGADFRKAYGLIKDIIPWLPTWTVRVGLTATLEPGRQTSVVMGALGFTDSNSILDRRDCERQNIDIVFRPVQYSISTHEFLDLDELIPPNLEKAADVPKTIVYCETIELGHRVATYLRRLLPLPLQKDGKTIVRHANSLNCPRCKSEILEALYQSGASRTLAIVVATDVLGVGMDVQDCDRVYCFPTPSSLSALVQRIGRTSRGHGRRGTAYVYIKKSDIEAVSLYLRTASLLDPRILRPTGNRGHAEHAQGPSTEVTPARVTRQTSSRIKSDTFQKNMALWCVVAAFVQGVCIVRQLNIIQGNPQITRDCGRCSSCRPRPLPIPRPHPSPNNTLRPLLSMSTTTPQDTTIARAPSHLRLTTADVNRLTAQLEAAALRVRVTLPYPPDAILIGAKAFLDHRWIARITEDFVLLTTQDALKARLNGWQHWDYYGDALWQEISRLREDLCRELTERHEARARDQRGKRKTKAQREDAYTEEEVRNYIATHGLQHIKRVKLLTGPSESSGGRVDTENAPLDDHVTLTTPESRADTCNAACSRPAMSRNLNRQPLSPRRPRNVWGIGYHA